MSLGAIWFCGIADRCISSWTRFRCVPSRSSPTRRTRIQETWLYTTRSVQTDAHWRWRAAAKPAASRSRRLWAPSGSPASTMLYYRDTIFFGGSYRANDGGAEDARSFTMACVLVFYILYKLHQSMQLGRPLIVYPKP